MWKFAKPVIVVLLFITASAGAPSAFSDDGFTVIVNASNPILELTSNQIADYFMKKDRRWADGAEVRFFDHRDDSPTRGSFLDEIMGKSSREIDLYWIGQKLYSGNSAPTQVPSDAMMVALVSRFRGAIGYVSADFNPGKKVRKIKIRGGE